MCSCMSVNQHTNVVSGRIVFNSIEECWHIIRVRNIRPIAHIRDMDHAAQHREKKNGQIEYIT